MKTNRIVIMFLLITLIFSCKINDRNNDSNTYNSEGNPAPVINTSQFTNIAELQGQLHSIAENQTTSVVSISTEKIVSQQDNYFDPFDFFFKSPWDRDNNNRNAPKNREYKQGGLGSGVIYKKKGNVYYVMTNNHVIDGVDKIKIIVNENKSYDGKIIAGDSAIDIAVVEINTKDELPIAKYGDSDKLKTGDFVIAIGNPYGLQGTMTFGIISALGRGEVTSGKANLTNFIQTDAAINPGNSGGALINLDGEVIGINTLIVSQSGGNVGIGFAIPINIAKNSADQIIDKGKVDHGWLGIYFEALTEDTIKKLNIKNVDKGIYVTKIVEGSPAEKSDIRAGDIILELNGKKLAKTTDLTIAVGNAAPGSKISLKILRNGKTMDKDVVLGDRSELKEDNPNLNKEVFNDLGFELSELDKNNRKEYKVPSDLNGAIISNIDQRGYAAQAGLQVGDVIYKINNTQVKSVPDVKKVLEESNDSNYFFISRKGKEFIIKM